MFTLYSLKLIEAIFLSFFISDPTKQNYKTIYKITINALKYMEFLKNTP
jgi:hypothetical protein